MTSSSTKQQPCSASGRLSSNHAAHWAVSQTVVQLVIRACSVAGAVGSGLGQQVQVRQDAGRAAVAMRSSSGSANVRAAAVQVG